MQNLISNLPTNKINAIYSKFDIDISGLVATNRVKSLVITPGMILSYSENIKNKLAGAFNLTKDQYKLFIENFDAVISDLSNNEVITCEILKKSLTRAFTGIEKTPKDILIDFIKGDFSIAKAKEFYLYDGITQSLKDSYNINISEIEDNSNLFEKILVTLFLSEQGNNFDAEFSDDLINISIEELRKIFNFIRENSTYFDKEIQGINKKFINKAINRISYIIPALFEKFIADNIQDYNHAMIDRTQLWTNSMCNIAEFITKINLLDKLLKQYVSYSFHTNTIGIIIKEYKEKLWEIDNLYREISGLCEELSYNYEFYIKIESSKVIEKIDNMYFNVISNINSKYISCYNDILADKSGVQRQDEVLKNIKFSKNTVFIFADGLRYELAKELKNSTNSAEVIDHDVFSLIPTETEICMNGYFITDEKLRINSKNVFELIKGDKTINQIIKWRAEKLSKILKCQVISFEEFKSTYDYSGCVFCFYNDIDNTIHSYNSAQKISAAICELKTMINYCIDRKFDVMLLSDHGFIDVETKIEVQDSELDTEKKKGRYLVLPSNEKVDTMFYKSDLKVADFVELKNKKICFINSINSLRRTTRFTHGGVSLQENIITALLFKPGSNSGLLTNEGHISNLKAFNELRAEINNAEGFECNVYTGGQKIFMTMIDTDDYKLRVPIRNYGKDQEFLISIKHGSIIEKCTIKKSSNTVVDKELDIF